MQEAYNFLMFSMLTASFFIDFNLQTNIKKNLIRHAYWLFLHGNLERKTYFFMVVQEILLNCNSLLMTFLNPPLDNIPIAT